MPACRAGLQPSGSFTTAYSNSSVALVVSDLYNIHQQQIETFKARHLDACLAALNCELGYPIEHLSDEHRLDVVKRCTAEAGGRRNQNATSG